MVSDVREQEYVDECPSCGARFIGMTPDEYRQTHAQDDCPKAPIPQLFVFRHPSERENDAQ